MAKQLTLDAWLDKLSVLHSKEIDLGLERVAEVGRRIDLLRPRSFVITVAGTNGKGSSVAMIQSILCAAGFRVGSYTSPHILKFNERIQINGNPISDARIVEAFELVDQARKEITLSYFEFATLAALIIFKQSELDFIVLEVGLGGRLDAVNIVDADACLLTAIDIDHVEWLGSDREKIGYEKACVMRSHGVAVCSDPNPPKSVIDYAANLGVALSLLNQDYAYRILSHGWEFEHRNKTIFLPNPSLLGDFQFQNAAGVICLLDNMALDLPSWSLFEGLTELQHPGRLQFKQIANQAWLLDVAHNPQSVQVLAGFVAKQPVVKRIAIFAGLADKDLLPMVKAMHPYIDQWLVVDLTVARATPLAVMKEILDQASVSEDCAIFFDEMQDAVDFALKSNFEQVLVYGSFVTVSQALEALDG